MLVGENPSYSDIKSVPVLVNQWQGPTSNLTWKYVPTPTTPPGVSVSGNSCADGKVSVTLTGLAASKTNYFSALNVALAQGGSSMGTLSIADWTVDADAAGEGTGEVALASVSGCDSIAAGTPFDVTATVTAAAGSTTSNTAQNTFPTYEITDDSDPAEGRITCKPAPYGGSTTCAAKPEAGYTFDTLVIADDPAGTTTLGACDASGCVLDNVTGAVTVRGVFKAVPQQPQPQPQPGVRVISDTPTMSEMGLLLSGIALAGAAVPALRRREKRGEKTDTN